MIPQALYALGLLLLPVPTPDTEALMDARGPNVDHQMLETVYGRVAYGFPDVTVDGAWIGRPLVVKPDGLYLWASGAIGQIPLGHPPANAVGVKPTGVYAFSWTEFNIAWRNFYALGAKLKVKAQLQRLGISSPELERALIEKWERGED